MRSATTCCSLLIILLLAGPAAAEAEYRCKGERIEKGSSSIGWAKKRNSKWSIETFGGSTLGWLSGDRIERPNGSTWTTLSDAKCLVRGGPDAVAAALWVLNQHGKL